MPIITTSSFEEARQRAAADELGAFISVAPADETTAPASDGGFAGVPFAVKDNIDTIDLPTTAGTPALEGSVPRRNHPAVQRLLDAGAQLVGKTNLHELAFGITSNNAWFGPVRNPYDPERSAAGSSGGSAAAVAAGIVPFALGTDTGGSCTLPAAWCGVVGFRPTTGRYGSGHAVPLSTTRDTVGVLADRVETVIAVDRLLAPSDAPARERPRVRLGLPSTGYLAPLDDSVAPAWERAREGLNEAGVEFVDVDTSGVHELEAACGFDIVFFEAVRDLEAYLRTLPDGAPTLDALVAEIASPDVAGLMQHALLDGPTFERYEACLATRERLRARFAELYEAAGIDALVYPTCPIGPTPLGEDLETRALGATVPVFATVTRNTLPGSDAGLPAISLPAGLDGRGYPFGVTVQGREGDDDALLAIAARLATPLDGD